MVQYSVRSAAIVALCAAVGSASAGLIIEIDTDGADDGVLTYNPAFNFGGDTTTASQSATVNAFGTTGGDSIFGGNGVNQPDTYVFAYSPQSQPDNLVIPAGTDLGDGNVGTGVVGGGFGTYRVYGLWPETNNVSGGLTTFDVVAPGDNFVVQINQNERGGTWILLGEIDYTGGVITVTQRATSNAFVSMRGYGVLFEAVPAPGSLALAAVAGLVAARRRR